MESVSQRRTDTEGFLLCEALKGTQIHRDRRWDGGCQGLGEGDGESLLKRHSYNFTKKRVLETNGVTVAQQRECA